MRVVPTPGPDPQEVAAGVDVRERGARADEALELPRALWSGDAVDFRGRFTTVPGLARVGEFADAGADTLVFSPVGSGARRREVVELSTAEVLPRLRDQEAASSSPR